jgi:biotin-(acetyl-CoA carboxylase) ligase
MLGVGGLRFATESNVHRRICALCAAETITGRFEGIEADGALILRRDDGQIDIVRAGDVHLD